MATATALISGKYELVLVLRPVVVVVVAAAGDCVGLSLRVAMVPVRVEAITHTQTH